MAKGYVVFDLAALHGSAQFVPGRTLQRHDKRALELMLAQIALGSLAAHESPPATNVRSNPNDPPDVLFSLADKQFGLEVAELLPDNRLERDAIIKQTKADIVARLPIGPATRDWVATVMLQDDYAQRLRPRFAEVLAATLTTHLERSSSVRQPGTIPLPAELRSAIRLVLIEPWDLAGDPRIGARDEPLIVFTAQHTNVVPDREFPALMVSVVGRKARHSLAGPTWLLLWSNHYAFGPFEADIVRHVVQYVQSQALPYARVFYLHLHHQPSLTEITRDAPPQRPRDVSNREDR
jgi:hypothetical protein